MRDSKRLVYISSPLRGDIISNISRAHEYCAYAASCGVLPLAPHTIFTNYLDDNCPEQRKQGLDMSLELLKHCDEIWIMGSVVSKGMQDEIALAEKLNLPRLYVADEMVQAGYKIRQFDEPYSSADCILKSNKMNYENQILVLKPEAIVNHESMSADDSLWIAKSGFGCTLGARGQSVFAESLLSGEKVRWERSDFYGVVDPVRLFSWLCDKPIHNETAEEWVKNIAEDLQDYNHESEEAEADM